ncbi:cytochrome c [Burkholderia sp. Nafp2/4-1b]|uniref:c-type cytochrome n=1 Tax=Burkholderia sp. Nafp2/4-1b TaxID=2116686 RepID=UPI000EF90012|nr:cytochrome c [Burkholderia sp. Nafp2/4-1b]
MNTSIRGVAATWLLPIVIGCSVGALGSHYLPTSASTLIERQTHLVPPVRFKRVVVQLPDATVPFPSGIGAALAQGQCVMCHDPAMVLDQPQLTQAEWVAVIKKMRGHFGAPVSDDDIRTLSRYFFVIDGRSDNAGPSRVDDQAS